ncbi:MAG: TRAP transporter TatT component family protein [Nitrospinota bacterium]
MRRALLLSAVLLLLPLGGCTARQAVARATGTVVDDFLAAMNAEGDIPQARGAAATLFVMIEGLLRADPANEDLRRAAAQAYGSYAFAFLEEREPARAREFYRRGRDHGAAALKARPGFGRAFEGEAAALREALAALKEEDLPLLFWTAYCWSGWVNLSRGDPDALADLPRAEAMMARALALDRTFHHGGPDLFFGVYYGGRPPLLGGDPAKAKSHFERALAATGGRFLMAKVLMARFLAVQTQDRALFEKLLKEVESAPEGLLPDQALANALARERARALLKQAEELF